MITSVFKNFIKGWNKRDYEKSLVLNDSETEEIKSYLKRKRKFSLCIINYTGYPMIRELKELISSGQIGELCHFSIQMRNKDF